MSSDDRRFGRQSNPAQENGAGQDGDDEFGDFEGFEGAALDSIPSAAGPSPWATFPDLLPMQTSPATTGNDEPGSSQMPRGPESHDHEPWLAGPSSSSQRLSVELLPNVAQDGVHGHFNQPRTINPPDVSLSASYQPAYNSEQACGSGPSGEEAGILEIGGQMASMQRQLDAVTQQKYQIQQQLDQLARDKTQLQQQLSASQSEGIHLRAQVVELQQQLAHLSSNSQATTHQEIVAMIQQLQDAVTLRNDTCAKETNGLKEAVEELRLNLDEKMAGFKEDLSQLRHDLEKEHLTEETGNHESVVATTIQTCFKQNLESLSQTVTNALSEVVRNQASPNQDGIVHNFQKELQRHVDQTRRLLERERQQNLLSLAQGLQAALKQFSATIEPAINDHNDASEDEKS